MLFILFDIVVSATAAALLSTLTGWVSHGYDFWIPIVIFAIGMLITWILDYAMFYTFGFIRGIGIDKENSFCKKHSAFDRFVMDQAFLVLNITARAKAHFMGMEMIPKDRRFLVITNHMSKWDPLVIGKEMKGYDISWVCKKELFSMPGVPNVLWRCCFLPIERENLRQSMRVISQASENITGNQCSMGIFPEGTRNKTEDVLLPLKPGSTKIAYKAQCPVVVIVSANTEKIAKRWPWRSTNVYIKVCKVYEYDDYKDRDTIEFTAEIEKIMRENITELRKNRA